MPIRTSPYIQDPGLAQAASNLAGLFVPPSGQEAAGWSRAKSEQEDAARRQWIFDNYNDPSASKRSSLTGIQNYGATPEGFRYNVDQGNATTLEQRRMMEQGLMDRQLISPISVNQDQKVFLPPALSDKVDLPAILEGNRSPLSETQQAARERQHLIEAGVITDDMLANDYVGQRAPVQAVGPDGKTPVYMSPGAAIREGAQPYTASADKALVEGTAVINGKSVQVYRAPTDSVYRTADGAPVPADIQVFDKAKPTGTNEQLGMKPTEFTTKNGMFGVRSAAANSNMNALLDSGYQPSAMDYEMSSGVGQKTLPTSASNSMQSPQGRQFYNAADNFVLSIARPDTGAAISNEELASFRKMYIPLPGDDPQTIANKRQAREIATAALSANSAGAADQTLKYLEANGVPIPDELRNRLDAIRSGQTGTAPQPQPQQGASTSAGIEDGTVIVKPGTDNRMIRRNGKWEPYNGR